MKTFFKDSDGNLSMGRLLSFSLFFICTIMWLIIKITSKELSTNDVNLITWGWGIAIAGKAISKFGEKK